MRFASAALGIMLAGLQVRQRIWNLWVSGQRHEWLHCTALRSRSTMVKLTASGPSLECVWIDCVRVARRRCSTRCR